MLAAAGRHFGFLDAHSFRTSGVEEVSAWETTVMYKTSHAAVQIAVSREFARAEIHLIRLVDGEVPQASIWITEEVQHWAMLDNVIEARRPELLERIPAGGLKDEDVERQLATWAELLLLVAPDFLEGDLWAIDDAAVVLRQRVDAHPQQVTVWLPDDDTSGAEADAVAEARGSVPPNVDVKVGRHRRFRRKRSGRTGTADTP